MKKFLHIGEVCDKQRSGRPKRTPKIGDLDKVFQFKRNRPLPVPEITPVVNRKRENLIEQTAVRRMVLTAGL